MRDATNLDPTPPAGGVRALAPAFLAAALLHAGILGAIAFWQSKTIVNPPGEQQISIDLAPEMADAPTAQAVETAQPAGAPSDVASEVPPDQAAAMASAAETDAKPNDTALSPPPAAETDAKPTDTAPAPPPEPTTDAKPVDQQMASPPPEAVPDPKPVEQQVVEAEPVQATLAPTSPVEAVPPANAPVEATAAASVIESSTIDAVPAPSEAVEPPSQSAQARPQPAPPARPTPPPPRPKPVQPKPVEPRPAPRQQARLDDSRPVRSPARSGAAGRSPHEPARGATSRDNMGGAAAAADPNALNRYASELAAALRGRLHHPPGGASGTAILRFTMQRSGRVLAASIVHSAGDPALDAAALAAASPGSSLPAAPDGVPQQQLTISVPLLFHGQ